MLVSLLICLCVRFSSMWLLCSFRCMVVVVVLVCLFGYFSVIGLGSWFSVWLMMVFMWIISDFF